MRGTEKGRRRTRRRPYSLRRRVRRSPFPHPSKNEGMARRWARHSVLVTCRCQHVAPLGAPSRRPYGAGPRFLRSASSRLRLSGTAPFGQPRFQASGRSCGPPSASSSRGVVVPSGGTPAPPERRRSVHLLPAGAASDPAITTPHESALGGPDTRIINPPKRARISFRSRFVLVCRR